MADLEKLRELRDVQGRDGNWNYDAYMQGLYNGMELAVAILEDREPVYRSAPAEWLHDKSRPVIDVPCGVALPASRSTACEHQCAEEQVGGTRCKIVCGVVELPPMDTSGVTPCQRCAAAEPRTGTCDGQGPLCADGVAIPLKESDRG